jgi:hypothetical protein
MTMDTERIHENDGPEPERTPESGSTPGSEERMEIWSAGDGNSYVYTNSWPMVQALRSRFGRGAEYIRDGVVMAWQFKIPRRLVDMLKRNYRRLRRAEIDGGMLADELARESP